jgi:hypothetical protein
MNESNIGREKLKESEGREKIRQFQRDSGRRGVTSRR